MELKKTGKLVFLHKIYNSTGVDVAEVTEQNDF